VTPSDTRWSSADSRWELIYTGAILAIVPSILLFAAFQRYFIKGMSIGAVKG